ncbi:MAG: hypothetical protein JXA33_08795 [Anaerolineae bacterium]|nr:hypothetical protein [Anaerolineae bacterium]
MCFLIYKLQTWKSPVRIIAIEFGIEEPAGGWRQIDDAEGESLSLTYKEV